MDTPETRQALPESEVKQMARNTKGEGSITQVKDKDGKPVANRWRVCVSLGYDLSGNRVRVQRIVSGTKSEARKERDKIRREHEID